MNFVNYLNASENNLNNFKTGLKGSVDSPFDPVIDEIQYVDYKNLIELLNNINYNIGKYAIKGDNDIGIKEWENVIEESNFINQSLDLSEALKSLTPTVQTIILLRYYHDLSIKEIAMLLDFPEGTVKSHLNRAKKELRPILKEGYLL